MRLRTRAALAGLLVIATMEAGISIAPRWAAAQPCPTTPGDAYAFLNLDPPDDFCPEDPVVHWAVPSVVFECGFFADGQHGVACGDTAAGCAERCRGAAAVWNAELPGRFTFVQATPQTPVGFCTSGSDDVDDFDGHTSIGGSDTLCDGADFGGSVLGVTLRRTIVSGPQRGELVDSDITLNNGFNFASGLLEAVIGHELGHVLGLDHPDECGEDFNVLMHSTVRSPSDPCFVSEPVADDVAGAKVIYALTGPTPTVTPTPAAGCGDADGDGGITVNDGVQTLRYAAGLSSPCTPARCDVDGDGTPTVNDGVNVLRASAGLSATLNCGS